MAPLLRQTSTADTSAGLRAGRVRDAIRSRRRDRWSVGHGAAGPDRPLRLRDCQAAVVSESERARRTATRAQSQSDASSAAQVAHRLELRAVRCRPPVHYAVGSPLLRVSVSLTVVRSRRVAGWRAKGDSEDDVNDRARGPVIRTATVRRSERAITHLEHQHRHLRKVLQVSCALRG